MPEPVGTCRNLSELAEPIGTCRNLSELCRNFVGTRGACGTCRNIVGTLSELCQLTLTSGQYSRVPLFGISKVATLSSQSELVVTVGICRHRRNLVRTLPELVGTFFCSRNLTNLRLNPTLSEPVGTCRNLSELCRHSRNVWVVITFVSRSPGHLASCLLPH